MTTVGKRRALGIVLALAIFAVDQAFKWWVTGPLKLQEVGVVDLASL